MNEYSEEKAAATEEMATASDVGLAFGDHSNGTAPTVDEQLNNALLELSAYGGGGHFATSYPIKGEPGRIGYKKQVGDLTVAEIARHRSASGPHLGIYAMSPGETTRLAVFDLDDHEGTLDPAVMHNAAADILTRLRVMSCNPLVFRSGRGKGMHIWLLWQEPQAAALVRKWMAAVLADVELMVGNAGGLAAGKVELFPASDRVTDVGSLIALPLGRQSIALAPDTLAPIGSWSIRHSPDAEKLGLMWAARDALRVLDADDYDAAWVRYGLALKRSFGEEGFPIWDEFSRKGVKYPQAACRKKWDRALNVEKDGVTVAAIFRAAEELGWQGRPDAAKGSRKRDGEQRQSQTDALLEMVGGAELWHAENGDGYITIRENGVVRNLRIASSGFRKWLSARMARTTGKAPNSAALEETVRTLDGRAEFDSPRRETWIRVAQGEGGQKVYLDLGREDWKVIEVDAEGWRENSDPPVKFRRPQRFQPLPIPNRGGTVVDLRRVLNMADDDFVLTAGWLIGCFRPGVPLPILWLAGEHGSAKTTSLKVCRSLVDPALAAGRGMARTEEDLLVAANNNWIVSADNLSHVDADMADALCRLSTGGGLSKRAQYTNDDEHTIEALRPQLYTGINLAGETRPDLMDRMIVAKLLPITEERRMTEAQFATVLAEVHPGILGGLLDAVSTALRRLPEVSARIKRLPRMADFALFVEAAAPALGLAEGKFLATYGEMRAGLNVVVADAIPVARAIRLFVDTLPDRRFYGTAAMLYHAIGASGVLESLNDRGWPKGEGAFGKHLRRVRPTLRGIGYDYPEPEEKDHVPWHTIVAPQKMGEDIVSVEDLELVLLQQKLDEKMREMDAIQRQQTELNAMIRAKLNNGGSAF